MMSCTPIRTPASWKMRAESSRPSPTRLQRLLVRPRAAEALDERRLGGHPVRLGVDEGAVHVPQDGGERGRVTDPCYRRSPAPPGRAARSRSDACGLSWREPAAAGEEVAWTDWDAGCSWPHSTDGTTRARRLRPPIAQLRDDGTYEPVFSVDPELYFDYQYTRPQIAIDAEGNRDAPLAGGDAARARRSPRAARSCGC